MISLASRLKPCGPVVDARAAARVREALGGVVGDAWPAMAPVFGASPYLAGLALRRPAQLAGTLTDDPERRRAAILTETRRIRTDDLDAVKRRLRQRSAISAGSGRWNRSPGH